jgi:hypothetical protein
VPEFPILPEVVEAARSAYEREHLSRYSTDKRLADAIRAALDKGWCWFACAHDHRFAVAAGEDLGRVRCSICGTITIQRVVFGSDRVDTEPSERRYIWVQPQMVGDLTAWNLAITHKGKQSWRLLTEAIIDGEEALDHDDFWIAEVSDNHLHAIWHSDAKRRNEAESDELAAVAVALGIQPSATSEGGAG